MSQALCLVPGVVTGEYGMRDAHKRVFERMQEWMRDKSKYVKRFAYEYAKSLCIDIKREEERVSQEEIFRKRGVDIR